jgi:hypothetical protein
MIPVLSSLNDALAGLTSSSETANPNQSSADKNNG